MSARWICDDTRGTHRPPTDDHALKPSDYFDNVRLRFVIERFMRYRGAFLDRRARFIKAFGPFVILVTAGPVLLRTVGPWCLLLTPIFMAIPIVWHEWRLVRTRRRVARGRLCFDCGYSLLNAAGDHTGWGRCSECGRRFHRSMYELDRWRLDGVGGPSRSDAGSAILPPSSPATNHEEEDEEA